MSCRQAKLSGLLERKPAIDADPDASLEVILGGELRWPLIRFGRGLPGVAEPVADLARDLERREPSRSGGKQRIAAKLVELCQEVYVGW